jgi:hypothetical protein
MKQIVRSFHIGIFLGDLELRKLEALKVGGVKNKKKKGFRSWKAFFFSCYFFITSFPLHFKGFLELEVVLL